MIGQTIYAPVFRWGQHLKTDRFNIKGITDYQIKRQRAEIERLQNAYKQCAWERDTFLEELKTAKSEARKEFAERLKEKAEFLKDDDDYIGYAECVRTCHIDNLLKEMDGE